MNYIMTKIIYPKDLLRSMIPIHMKAKLYFGIKDLPAKFALKAHFLDSQFVHGCLLTEVY